MTPSPRPSLLEGVESLSVVKPMASPKARADKALQQRLQAHGSVKAMHQGGGLRSAWTPPVTRPTPAKKTVPATPSQV